MRELKPQLDAIATADVPDGWLAVGAIRNRVWNRVLGDCGMPETDWDVTFAGDVDAREVEFRLSEQLSGPWEASDQRSYGHQTAAHGIASWPETATAIGARLPQPRTQKILAHSLARSGASGVEGWHP